MADFSKTSGEMLTKEQRGQMVDNYRVHAGDGAPRSEFFGKKFLKELMRQCTGKATGLKIEYGRDINGLRLIVTPCGEDGKELPIPAQLQGLKDEPPANGGGGSSTRCPNSCS